MSNRKCVLGAGGRFWDVNPTPKGMVLKLCHITLTLLVLALQMNFDDLYIFRPGCPISHLAMSKL